MICDISYLLNTSTPACAWLSSKSVPETSGDGSMSQYVTNVYVLPIVANLTPKENGQNVMVFRKIKDSENWLETISTIVVGIIPTVGWAFGDALLVWTHKMTRFFAQPSGCEHLCQPVTNSNKNLICVSPKIWWNHWLIIISMYSWPITYTIWLFNIAMENPPIFKNGKPSINGPSIPWLCWS